MNGELFFMEVGMFVNNLTISGGYQKLVINLAKELMTIGYSVTVYTFNVDKANCYPEEITKINIVSLNEEIHEKSTQNHQKRNLLLGMKQVIHKHPHNFELLSKIRQAIREKKALRKNCAKLTAKIKNNTEVIIIHDTNVIHILNSLKTIKKTQIIWMLNNQLDNFSSFNSQICVLFSQYPTKGRPFKLSLLNLLLRIILFPFACADVLSYKNGIRKVNNFAVYDKYNQTLVQKKYKKNATIVAAGADIETFEALYHERSYCKLMEIKILSVGVMFPHRRYEDIIKATKNLLDYGYHPVTKIIGSPKFNESYFFALKDLVAELNLEKYVFFYGSIPSNELQDIYLESDVFVFVNDGFTWGISVFEAIASGLPVIISNNIGAADIIQNDNLGWVVKPRSPTEISSSVIDIIGNNEKTRRIILNSIQKTKSIVSWIAYAHRMDAIINKLGNNNG